MNEKASAQLLTKMKRHGTVNNEDILEIDAEGVCGEEVDRSYKNYCSNYGEAL